MSCGARPLKNTAASPVKEWLSTKERIRRQEIDGREPWSEHLVTSSHNGSFRAAVGRSPHGVARIPGEPLIGAAVPDHEEVVEIVRLRKVAGIVSDDLVPWWACEVTDRQILEAWISGRMRTVTKSSTGPRPSGSRTTSDRRYR